MALVTAELSNQALHLEDAASKPPSAPHGLEIHDLLAAGVRCAAGGEYCVNFWQLHPGDILLSGHVPSPFAGVVEQGIFRAQRAIGHSRHAAAWHHVALLLSDGLVVESRTSGGVQLVTLSHFLNRNAAARIAARRHVGLAPGVSAGDTERLENIVTAIVGAPYRGFGSLLGQVRQEFHTRGQQSGPGSPADLLDGAVCSEVAHKALSLLLRENAFTYRRIPCPADFASAGEFQDVPLAWHRLP